MITHHFGNRGEIVGVYCTVKTSGGDYLTECMSIDEVYSIRNRSESYKRNSGPWVTDAGEMIKKTVVKRANKYWPKVERLSNAIEYLNTVNGEGIEKEPVMQHYSEKEIHTLEQEQKQKFNEEVEELCSKMSMCESMEQLKGVFSEAYVKTKGNPLQQNVQAIYSEMKVKLNG